MVYYRVGIILVARLETDDFQYIKEVLMVKYLINIFPAFLQLLCDFNFANFIIKLLEILEP